MCVCSVGREGGEIGGAGFVQRAIWYTSTFRKVISNVLSSGENAFVFIQRMSC